jgi:hypothetical protein
VQSCHCCVPVPYALRRGPHSYVAVTKDAVQHRSWASCFAMTGDYFIICSTLLWNRHARKVEFKSHVIARLCLAPGQVKPCVAPLIRRSRKRNSNRPYMSNKNGFPLTKSTENYIRAWFPEGEKPFVYNGLKIRKAYREKSFGKGWTGCHKDLREFW